MGLFKGPMLGLVGIIFSFCSVVNAGFIDTNLFYFSKGRTVTSEDETENQTLIDLGFGFDIDKKGSFQIGWSVSSFSSTEATAITGTATTTTLSASEMGPKFGYYIDKDQWWGVFLTYNLISTTTYKRGTGDEAKWSGTTIKAEVGFAPQITENIYGGLRLNYYIATFASQIVGTDTYSVISNTRSLIYPAIYFSYRM